MERNVSNYPGERRAAIRSGLTALALGLIALSVLRQRRGHSSPTPIQVNAQSEHIPTSDASSNRTQGVEFAERLPDDKTLLTSVNIPTISGSWRREVVAITENLYYLSRWLQLKSEDKDSQALIDTIDAHLKAARHDIGKRRIGVNLTAILGHLQSAAREYFAPSSALIRSQLPTEYRYASPQRFGSKRSSIK